MSYKLIMLGMIFAIFAVISAISAIKKRKKIQNGKRVIGTVVRNDARTNSRMILYHPVYEYVDPDTEETKEYISSNGALKMADLGTHLFLCKTADGTIMEYTGEIIDMASAVLYGVAAVVLLWIGGS